MTHTNKPDKKTDIRTTFVVGSLISVIAMAGYGTGNDSGNGSDSRLASFHLKEEAELKVDGKRESLD